MRFAWSTDGAASFAPALELDGAGSFGQVGLVLAADGTANVTWWRAAAGGGTDLVLRTVASTARSASCASSRTARRRSPSTCRRSSPSATTCSSLGRASTTTRPCTSCSCKAARLAATNGRAPEGAQRQLTGTAFMGKISPHANSAIAPPHWWASPRSHCLAHRRAARRTSGFAARGDGAASRSRRLSLPDHDGERRRAGLFRPWHSPALRVQPRRSRALLPPRGGARPASADAVLGRRAVDRAELQRHGRRRRARAGDLRRRQERRAARRQRERSASATTSRRLAKRYPSPEPAADWLGFHRDYSQAMRAMVAKYPDDLDAATMFAESLMMLRPWQLWSLEGEPAAGTLELVAVLESVLAARSGSSRRESLLHPRRRGVAESRARDPERDAPHDVDAGRRASRAHAGPHLPADRRLRSRCGDERQSVRGGSRVHRADRRDGRLSADVLDAQHPLHRVRARAAGPLRGGEAGGRRDGRQRRRRRPRDADARRVSPVSADGRSAVSPLGHDARDAGARAEPRVQPRVLALRARDGARGQGKAREATAEQRRFERERAAVPPEGQYIINNKAGDVLALAAATLDAQLAAARGDRCGRSRLGAAP